MALGRLSGQIAISANAGCSIAVHELGLKDRWQPVLMDAAAKTWGQTNHVLVLTAANKSKGKLFT